MSDQSRQSDEDDRDDVSDSQAAGATTVSAPKKKKQKQKCSKGKGSSGEKKFYPKCFSCKPAKKCGVCAEHHRIMQRMKCLALGSGQKESFEHVAKDEAALRAAMAAFAKRG